MSAMPLKRRLAVKASPVAMGHVWTAPGWQELSSRVQQWSEQPCVRPVSAVHVTAGHNALRGSGPGQNHALDNALAHVGCPDRRIDRLCITCCSPFPTVTSRRMPDAISFTPRVRRVPCSARPWSSSPTPWQPGVLRIGDNFKQLLYTIASNRRNDPDLRKVCADRIDDGGLLADE